LILAQILVQISWT